MAKLTQEDISRLEENGITIGATVTCAFLAGAEIKIKSWNDWEVEENGSISSIKPIDDEDSCWLYNNSKRTYATVVKPAPSVQRKFKQGDIVLIGQYGKKKHVVNRYINRCFVEAQDIETGKQWMGSQNRLKLIEKKRPEPPKPTPSYEVDWKDAPTKANYHAFDRNKKGYWYPSAPMKDDEEWFESNSSISNFTLPDGLDWKQPLTTRPEPIQTEQPKPEPTIDEQIEAARAELERLKKIKEREQPIAFMNDIQQLSVIGYDVFIANVLAPRGLEHKCIMFETANIELRTQQHNEYTVLTFHRK